MQMVAPSTNLTHYKHHKEQCLQNDSNGSGVQEDSGEWPLSAATQAHTWGPLSSRCLHFPGQIYVSLNTVMK